MHRSLHVPELLGEIVRHLDPVDDRQLLKSLAVVCKSFSHPSLDLLWHTIPVPAFFTLLKLTPEDCWEETVSTLPEGGRQYLSLRFLRRLVRRDYERLLSYSRRVKSIGGRSIGEPFPLKAESIHADMTHQDLEDISSAMATLNPFPNLQQVTLYTHNNAPYSLYHTLMVPTLQDVTWVFLETQLSPTRSLYSKLADSCKSMEKVMLCQGAGHRGFTSFCASLESTILPSFSRIPALTCLNMIVTTTGLVPFLENLRHLPHIDELVLYQQHNDTLPSSMPHIDNLPSPRQLSMYECSFGMISALVSSIGAARLSSLILQLSSFAYGESQLHLFSALPELTTRFPHLVDIVLDVHEVVLTGVYPPLATSDCLQPFACRENLQHIYLSPAGLQFIAKPGTLVELTKCWPLLETFYFAHLPRPEDVLGDPPDLKHLAIQELKAFVVHCPRLYKLTITLNAMNLSESDIHDLGGDSFVTHLTPIDLCFKWTPFEDEDVMARFLTTLFYDLVIECERWETYDWRPVTALCEAIQAARAAGADDGSETSSLE